LIFTESALCIAQIAIDKINILKSKCVTPNSIKDLRIRFQVKIQWIVSSPFSSHSFGSSAFPFPTAAIIIRQHRINSLSTSSYISRRNVGVSPCAYPCSQGNHRGLPLQNTEKIMSGYLQRFIAD